MERTQSRSTQPSFINTNVPSTYLLQWELLYTICTLDSVLRLTQWGQRFC